MWIYVIARGELWHRTPDGTTELVGTGYSGRGVGLNNPLRVSESNVGPLPPGWYTVGTSYHSRRTGPLTFPLIPDDESLMFGRSDMCIHGNSSVDRDGNGKLDDASRGCCIQDLTPRLKLNAGVLSGDRRLHVVVTREEERL